VLGEDHSAGPGGWVLHPLTRESLETTLRQCIADPQEVVRRAPDIILGSWCGKKFQPKTVAAREGWGEVPAVANAQLHEIKSSIILQPGPAALTDGIAEIHKIFKAWQATQAAR
jgi:iron complex transport system substrate-binding protein